MWVRAGFVSAIILLASVVEAAALDSTRMEYAQKPIIHPGPLPGTSIVRSVVRKIDFSSEAANKPGRIYGECFALVASIDPDRDFSKSPLRKDEVMGFSCSTEQDK